MSYADVNKATAEARRIVARNAAVSGLLANVSAAWVKGFTRDACIEVYAGVCAESSETIFDPRHAEAIYDRLNAEYQRHVASLWREYYARVLSWQRCYHLTPGQGYRGEAAAHEPYAPAIPIAEAGRYANAA